MVVQFFLIYIDEIDSACTRPYPHMLIKSDVSNTAFAVFKKAVNEKDIPRF